MAVTIKMKNLMYNCKYCNLIFNSKKEYKHHYDREGNLLQKDIDRQNEIIEKLGCRFFRYNERTKQLYEFFIKKLLTRNKKLCIFTNVKITMVHRNLV